MRNRLGSTIAFFAKNSWKVSIAYVVAWMPFLPPTSLPGGLWAFHWLPDHACPKNGTGGHSITPITNPYADTANRVSVRRTAWGVGEESRGREARRDSFVRRDGRYEAIILDVRRAGPMGELSPRLTSLAVRSAMVVRIRRMTDPKCSKKKQQEERRLSPSLLWPPQPLAGG